MKELFYLVICLVSVGAAAYVGFKFGSASIAIVANDYVHAITESGYFGITYDDVAEAMKNPVVIKKAREYIHEDFTDVSVWKKHLANTRKNK